MVDPDRVRQDVAGLLRTDGFRNFQNPEAMEQAARYIRSAWEWAGFEVREQEFEVYEGIYFKNLYIRYGPEGAPLLVVGAHYDVCGDQDGADDNASGVSALLAIARILNDQRPQLEHQLELVAYALEEPPFFKTPRMGSAVHARELERRGVEVKGMIALDLIGYFDDRPGSQDFPLPLMKLVYPTTGNFICVVGNLGSRRLTRQVKTRMAGACTVPVESINAPSLVPGVDFSDHYNYWRRGYPAVMVTDTAFYRNPNYHQPSDTIETLDFRRLAQVIKGLYAAVTTL
jgi:Zn-dependent M28 family amino/carboxypeptidase